MQYLTCGITLQDKLEKLQDRAARVLTFSNYDANADQLLEILGWKKSWPSAEHTKGHHDFQMPAWVSSIKLIVNSF